MKGIIYILRSNNTEKFYIGSTFRTLKARLTAHRRNYNYFTTHNKKYISSIEILKYGDCYIDLVESFENLKDKEELLKYESIYIQFCRELKEPIINISLPYIDIGERTERKIIDKTEKQIKKSEYDKQRRLKLGNILIEKKKIYNDKNKERISIYNKEYREKNKKIYTSRQKYYKVIKANA